ncbi:MAG: hypothetical protein WBB37_11900 [bacterium]
MSKYITLSILIISMGFSYGVRPSFGLQAAWSYLKPEVYDGSHFINPAITTTAPFNEYIGLSASVFWLSIDLSEEGTMIGLSSRIGFIEMIPTKNVSPYFEQSIILDHMSSGGYSMTDFGFAVGLGVEFLSSSYVSPYLGGEFSYQNMSFDGYSSHQIGFGSGLGVRFSWVK